MSIAKPLPHESARLHVTGQARYIDEIFEGDIMLLYVVVGFKPDGSHDENRQNDRQSVQRHVRWNLL